MGQPHKTPSECPTLFQCSKKRSQVFQRALHDAYNDHPTITPVLMSLVLLLLVVGIGFKFYRMRCDGMKIRKLKHAEAYRAAVEKGQVPAFSDNV